jgi:YaiO family outer membrane protein
VIVITIVGNVSADEKGKKYHRVESSLSFDHLSPNAVYGDWKTLNISYFSEPTRGTTYFFQSSLYSRVEGDGLTGTGGLYKEWQDFLYTYSTVTKGSNISYLPDFRIDHDFNFKLGFDKKLVLTIGGTYIDYFTDQSSTIISGGPTYYWGKWIFQYRYFNNNNNPGSVRSRSQLFKAGYGQEGLQWTWFSYSFGNQAYLATNLVDPEMVNQDSFELILQHRHWFGKQYGIFGNISFFKLDQGYKKTGFTFGAFYSF